MTNNTHMSGNSAAYDRKNAKDSILYAYAKDFIEDIEFFLLYDSSDCREVYPYQKFHSFDLDSFDEAQCLT